MDAPTPPPLPPALPPTDRRGVVFDGRVVPGTEALTATDLAEEVLAGGRFVFFQYCFSILILTFRRPTSLVFLKRDEDAGKHALGWSLLTLLVGWWGIPWGPIYTVGALITNARGGKDVTREVLGGVLPAPAIEPLMQQRRRPAAGPLLWTLRALLLGAPLALVALFSWVAAVGAKEEAEQRKLPGYGAFEAADQSIKQRAGAPASGNTREAQAIASDFCHAMKLGRDSLFVKKGDSSSAASDDEFHAWCELRPGRCVILVKVPELRRFNDEAKDAICQMAWAVARGAAEKHLATQDKTTLAVGVRGFALYERLMTGQLHDAEKDAGPATSVTHNSAARTRLTDLFKP